MRNKLTLVLGASTNPERYSNLAIKQLIAKQHTVVAIGNIQGLVAGVNIETTKTDYTNINTVTIYLNPTLQQQYYDYLISLKPQRIIFNPGTENPKLQALAAAAGINCINACTLVMLSTGQY